MKKNLTATMALIAAATAAFGMTASADDAKTAEIVLEAENAPYTYEDDNGEPAGYEYEVLKLIDDYLDDWTFNYTVLDYETALAGTTSGKYDLDSGCKFRTPAREEAFLVSNPYNYFFMNLVVKNDSGIKSLEDMDGKSIAPIVATDGRAVTLADWMEKHPDIKLDFETLAASGAMADEITSVEDGVYDAAYLSAEQANAILEETGYDEFDAMMRTNVYAPYLLCRDAIAPLRKSDCATIINIGSVVSHKGYPTQSAYGTAKHALLGMTKALAAEVYRDGIRVHIISPGAVNTEMARTVSRPDIDMNALIGVEDIADTAEFLLTHRGNAVIDEVQLHRIGKQPF